MRILINRFWQNEKQTEGEIHILDELGSSILKGVIIELKDFDNQKNISRIPEGEYEVIKRYSPKHKNHFHILDVPNRSYILIHSGNYYTQIEGCILVGFSLKDINGDGFYDAFRSRKFLDLMLELLPNKFRIKIADDIAIEL